MKLKVRTRGLVPNHISKMVKEELEDIDFRTGKNTHVEGRVRVRIPKLEELPEDDDGDDSEDSYEEYNKFSTDRELYKICNPNHQQKHLTNHRPPRPKVNLAKLGADTLWRYWIYYDLDSKNPNPSDEEIIEGVNRHFLSQVVDENDLIEEFIRKVKEERPRDSKSLELISEEKQPRDSKSLEQDDRGH